MRRLEAPESIYAMARVGDTVILSLAGWRASLCPLNIYKEPGVSSFWAFQVKKSLEIWNDVHNMIYTVYYNIYYIGGKASKSL